MARCLIHLALFLLLACPVPAWAQPADKNTVQLPSFDEKLMPAAPAEKAPAPVALPGEGKPKPKPADEDDEATEDPSDKEITAALLYDMCSEDHPASLSQCHAYLGGQWELMSWMGLGNFNICPPRQGVTLEMLRQLVIRWLEKNQGAESLPRAEALMRAMRFYYGCPQPRGASKPRRK